MKKKRLIKVKNKKRIQRFGIILFFILFFLISYFLIFYKNTFNKKVVFKLTKPILQKVEVNTMYEELGCNVYVDGIDNTNNLKIDSTELDISKLGEYQVKYYIEVNNKEYSHYRKVKVVDETPADIILNGNDIINLVIGDKYKELGATAKDNYDGDITNKIEVTGEVDTSKVGEYIVTYSVVDSSGNASSINRNVVVDKPKKIVYENKAEENAPTDSSFNIDSYSNTITANKFTTNGIYIEGTKKNSNGTYKILFDDKYSFDMTAINSTKYKGNIIIDNIDNGTYKLYIVSNTKEALNNGLDYIDKLVRSKVGNKLVTFNYKDNEVSITIEDFIYQYDILIDPGHGGTDTGSSNKTIDEKDINLKISQYEKCRFESMGYKVYMTRDSDNYGAGMGSASKRLHKRAYEIGYYGAVSKVVYSNHHNAISNTSFMGYEILVPGAYSSSELSPEIQIANKFNSLYPLTENHLRFFATNYDTEQKYNMLLGNTYSFNDNYAVNRIPYKIFNTKAVIYEGCYLTNMNDFNWYWNEGNWKKVSEIKIESYVNYIGGTYNSDNSSCLK